jgi:hypothetical protein
LSFDLYPLEKRLNLPNVAGIAEQAPHKSIDLCGASLVEVKANRVGEMEYFPFVLSHPKCNKTYNFAATTKADADDWINKIKHVCNQQHSLIWNSNGAVIDRLLERKVTMDDVDEQARVQVVKPEETLKDIPSKYQAKIELAVEVLLSSADTTTGWEAFYEKSGVNVKKRQGCVLTVKAETTLPYNLPDIMEILLSSERMKSIESQIHSIKVLKSYSSNTMVVYRQAKQVSSYKNALSTASSGRLL